MSPKKEAIRLDKKRKLDRRYVRPYTILKRVSKVSYMIESPVELAALHPDFHILLFKKCVVT